MINLRIKTRRIRNDDPEAPTVYRWVAHHGELQAAASNAEDAATRLLDFMSLQGKTQEIHKGQPGKK